MDVSSFSTHANVSSEFRDFYDLEYDTLEQQPVIAPTAEAEAVRDVLSTLIGQNHEMPGSAISTRIMEKNQ